MAKPVDFDWDEWEEIFRAWSDALDFRVDIHLRYIKTKDPLKRKRGEATYKKAERVSNRLLKDLVRYGYKARNCD